VASTRSTAGVAAASCPSAVNQITSTRMVKKQQMRWSPRGAHLLLQLRTHVLNDDLADDFNRRCCICGSEGAAQRVPTGLQMAVASSVNAAATRSPRGASTPSS
jgi:hypothetical protein